MHITHLIRSAVLLMVVSASVLLEAQESRGDQSSLPLTPAWVQDAIFYQIFPERFANGDTSNDPLGTEPWGGEPKSGNYFGGDLQGIINHLEYISSLGVNTLYLNPIFQSNSNHKYYTDDYFRIDPAFGDERLFRNLVDACHARGIRIIIDGVFNHSGVRLFAFQDIKKNEAKSKYLGWYNVHSFPVGPPGKPNYECWWGHGNLPKLMTQNPEVRDYLFKVTAYWMKFGIDGWRLDVPNEIPHPFWIEWRKLVKSINPDAYIVGEIWDDAGPWLKGDQFDAVMNYRFRDACINFFVTRKTNAANFDSALTTLRTKYPDNVNLAMQNLLGSHDTERLLTLCNGDKEAMMLAWLFQMTYLGAPMVYYGDEVGMTGGKDPGCRHTMIWDETKQDVALLQYMKSLIALRKEHAELRQGTFQTLMVDLTTNAVGFLRRSSTGSSIVVINNSKKSQSVAMPLNDQDGAKKWTQVWPGSANEIVVNHNTIQITVPAMSGLVFKGGKKE